MWTLDAIFKILVSLWQDYSEGVGILETRKITKFVMLILFFHVFLDLVIYYV